MTPMNHKWIRFQEVIDDVGVLTLDRVDKRNAFHDEMIEEFIREIDQLAQEPPRVLILRGAGDRSFSAGYDLACVDPDQSPEDPLPDERFERVVLALMGFPSPVIAVLNGSAYGGGLDLALACDFRIAVDSDYLSFAMPPCRLGLVYSAAGIKRFLEKLGGQTTRRLFLTGAPIPGPEAVRLGIVDFLVPEEELMDRALAIGREILKCSELAVAGTRRTIQHVEKGPEGSQDRDQQLDQFRIDALKSKHLRDFVAAFQGGGDGDRDSRGGDIKK